MSRYKGYADEDKENPSISFYTSQIIDKMADLIADYIEMLGDHPDFKDEMVLCWDGKYYVRVYQNIPMEYSTVITTKKD